MKKNILLYAFILYSIMIGCFEIPEEGTLSDRITFNMSEVPIYLRTQQIIGEGYGLKLKAGETTFPFHLSIEKVTRLNEDGSMGEDATAMFKKDVTIKKWKHAFTQKEKTREEFEAKREEISEAILHFSEANDLIFNYGDESIPIGLYALDIRVTNSSGSKVFENMLKINVKEATPYLLMQGRNISGADKTKSCEVTLEKRSSDRENLTVQIVEKDGTIVPLDSLRYTSDSYSFNKIFHFSQTHTENEGTHVDLPFPVPYNPGDIAYQPSIYRGSILSANRHGVVTEYVPKKDPEGNIITDPITGKPIMEEQKSHQLKYGFDRIRFIIYEPGDWLMTIKFK